MIDRFFATKTLQIASIVALCLWLVSLPFHPINIDDAWNGEIAYWGSRGVAKVMSFSDYSGLDQQAFFHHKGLIVNGIASIKAFGFHPGSLKIVSVFYAFLLLTSLLFWQEKLGWHKGTIWLAALLTLSTQVFFEFGYAFRAETALAFFSFNAALLLAYFDSKKTAAWAGALTGLAIFFHLNAASFAVAGAILIIYQKQFSRLIPFCFATGLFGLLYFYDIRSLADFQTFLVQFNSNSAVLTRAGFGMLERIALEHKRYFHTLRETSMSLVIVWIFFQFKELKKTEKNLMTYWMISALGLAMLAHSKTARYLVYFLPIIYLVASEVALRSSRKKTAALLFTALLLTNWSGNIEHIVTRDKKLTVAEMNILMSDLPAEAKIVGPFEIFFAAADRFDFLTVDYIDLLRALGGHKEMSREMFLELALSKKRQYVISNNQWNSTTGFDGTGALKCIRDWCLYSVQTED